MAKAILALITAVAIAIPTIWAWKQSAARKKEQRAHEKTIKDIRKAVSDGDTTAVHNELAKWL